MEEKDDFPAKISRLVIRDATTVCHLSGTFSRITENTHDFTADARSCPGFPKRLVVKQYDDMTLYDREAKAYALMERIQGTVVPRQYTYVECNDLPNKPTIVLEFIDGSHLLLLVTESSPRYDSEAIQRGLLVCYEKLSECGVQPGDDELHHIVAVEESGTLLLKRIDFDDADMTAGMETCKIRNNRVACNLYDSYLHGVKCQEESRQMALLSTWTD